MEEEQNRNHAVGEGHGLQAGPLPDGHDVQTQPTPWGQLTRASTCRSPLGRPQVNHKPLYGYLTVTRGMAIGVAAISALAAMATPSAWELATFKSLSQDVRATRVVVEKGARRLTVYGNAVPLKTYPVALGREPLGAKEVEGDGKTPEGLYTVDWRKADSQFHLALHVSYPEAADVANAAAAGHDAGGLIMIHGLRNGLGLIGPVHRAFDWTNGCIAVTNREIEELWRVVPNGTPIELLP